MEEGRCARRARLCILSAFITKANAWMLKFRAKLVYFAVASAGTLYATCSGSQRASHLYYTLLLRPHAVRYASACSGRIVPGLPKTPREVSYGYRSLLEQRGKVSY